jgi:predicted DNA-binding protein
MKYVEPYERTRGPEVDEEFEPLFPKHRAKSVLVSIRMPEELLQRVKRLAQARETRYQTLMKRILESALSQIEQEEWASLEEAAAKHPSRGAESAAS